MAEIFRRRQTVTVYCRWKNPATQLFRPFRRVLRQATWFEQGNVIARQTGVVLAGSAFVQAFYDPGMEYVPAHIWADLTESELDGKWTADFSSPPQATLMVGHETEFEFDWGTSGAVTTAENTFLRETPGAKRISALPEDNRRGSIRVQHILLRG